MKLSACTAAFGLADLKKIIDTSAELGYSTLCLNICGLTMKVVSKNYQ